MIGWTTARKRASALLVVALIVQMFGFGPFFANASVEAAGDQNGEEYYVSAQYGDDVTGDGSYANPWATIQHAADAAQAGDTVYIREGVYRETITPAHSGMENQEIVYRNYEQEQVVIAGTDEVTGWQAEGGGVYSAQAQLSLGFGNQVFVGGEMMTEARWPNLTGDRLQPEMAVMSSGSPTTITSEELPAGIDPVGANVWFRGGAGWAGLDSEVTAYDSATKTLTMLPVGSTGANYDARVGNPFFLWGKQEFLDAEKEWWYDDSAGTLYLMSPGGGMPSGVEVKTRTFSFNLSGKSYIQLIGLHTSANTIMTDDVSSHLLFEGLKLEYISHLTRTPNKDGRPPDLYRGMQLKGSYHVVRNSEFAYSSSGLLFISGGNHTVINNYLHDGNYLGTWGGLVTISGAEHYVGYNTMTRAGRDIINMSASKTIIEHNDLSHGALICNDTAMIYSPNTDGRGTEIRYNKVHDSNPGAHLGMGIYLDNFTSNFAIHHNVIWNVHNSDPIRLNAPSNFNLVFNNTMATNTRALSVSGARYNRDMYGARLFNNIINATVTYLDRDDIAHGNNIYISSGQDPEFVDAANLDFRIGAGSPAVDNGMVIPGITDGYLGSAPDIGAYEFGQADMVAGHDFNVQPVPNRTLNVIPYANRVVNNGFETQSLAPWVEVAGTAEAWNAGGAAWTSDDADSRSQRASLRLSGQQAEAEQTIEGLTPNTRYSFSAWSKVSGGSAEAVAGVRDYGGSPLAGSNENTGWTKTMFDFVTGPTDTSATVFLRKSAGTESGDATIIRLDEQPIASASQSYLYDVTSFVEGERDGDETASFVMKVEKASLDKRVTFNTREVANPDRRPALVVTYADNSVQVLTAVEDAGVKYRNTPGYTDSNTGAISTINASYHNDGFIENMYLKFDLTGLTQQDIAQAELRLFATAKLTSSDPVRTVVFGLSDDSWEEMQLTWEIRPVETEAAESYVFFDDIGLILPLDDIDYASALRNRLLEAQVLAAQYAGSDQIDESIIDDLEAAIQAANDRLLQSPTEAELLQELEALTAKVTAFRARIALAERIDNIGQLHDAAEEGELSGQYLQGAKAELSAAIQAARAVSNLPSSDEAAIAAGQAALEQALELFHNKVVLQEVALLEKADIGAMLADAAGWSAAFGGQDGYSTFTGTISKYNQIIGDKVFTFGLKYTYANDTEWPGIVLRSQNPALPVLGSGDTSYFIVFKQNIWELQKRINGTQIYLKTYANTHLQSGDEAKIDVGAINVIGGVRVFAYVDGRKVFDFVDTEDPIAPGYMGFVPQGGRSDGIHVRPNATPEATLQGPLVVQAGEAFVQDVRVDRLAGLQATRVELELTYDSDVMELVGAEAVPEGWAITALDDATDGQVKVTAASAIPVGLTEGGSIVRLQLQAKQQPVSTTLTLYDVVLSDEQDQHIDAVAYSRQLWIIEADNVPGSPATASLSGPAAVLAGAPFELSLGAAGIGGMTTLTAELTYDPAKLAFASELSDNGTPLDESDDYYALAESAYTVTNLALQVLTSALKPEQGKLLLVLVATAGGASDGELLLLRGQALAEAEPGAAAVAVSQLKAANAEVSADAALEDAAVTINVQLADKAALTALIGEAQQRLAGASGGSQPGEYPQSAIDALEAAVDTAAAAQQDAGATTGQVAAAVLALQSAIASFAQSQVPWPNPEPADKTALIAAIQAAQKLVDGSQQGNKLGQYTGSKEQLQQAIAAAEAVRANAAATQLQVNSAAAELEAAAQTYAQTRVTLVPGQSQITIRDLAIVAKYFGATGEDDNWNEIEQADLYGEGITLRVLAAVAQMIVNEWLGD